MLGQELERAIDDAWVRVRREILSDRDELHRRLARRRMKSLTRPPRAWCIAIRASDRRITPAHWIITPEHAMDLNHPEHPYEPIEHEVTIQTHAIRRYCHPVSFSREDAADVAKMLGVSAGTLRGARLRGQFSENYIAGLGGKRGKPVPLLSPKGELLDPSARGFARPHPIWGSMWEFLSGEMPEDFEQTVIRRPHFGKMIGRRTSPTGEVYKDEMQLRGWRWVCPVCKKEVRRIYYPVAVRTLFDSWFIDPVIQKRLCDADLVEAPAATFACMACHGVYHFCSIAPGAWNRVITYLTAGMLYGREVAKPASFVPERKRARTRLLNREAPVRRKVLARLRNGWTYFQIARDLKISLVGVGMHVLKICREEGVAFRHALAEKLKFAVLPLLNQFERAKVRREVVKGMMLGDCTQREIMERMGIDQAVLQSDVRAIYRVYGISGKARGGRRKLAERVGVGFVGRREAERATKAGN